MICINFRLYFQIVVLALVFMLIAPVASHADDININKATVSVNSAKEISGHYLGIQFLSTKTPDSAFVEVVIILKNKEIKATIGQGKERGNISITCKNIHTEAIANITEEERQLLHDLLISLLKEGSISNHDTGKMLLRTLNLLYSWPAESLDINISLKPNDVFDDCNVPGVHFVFVDRLNLPKRLDESC